ncbi:MAG: hypothetical protein QOK29_246 [Rhodospirillaceae bacterium]|jgi:hypothetical protein|nr:hypothetical protein [Rhodospirillaceae bacterium]
MSHIYLVVVVFGLIGAAIFIVGFLKGVRDTIRERRNPTPESDEVDEKPYGSSAIFAVLASAVVIGLAGVAPAWIYLGPLLAIVTAIGVGVAFLVGDRPARSRAPGS